MIRNVVFDIGRVLVEFDPAAYIKTFGFAPATAQTLEEIVFGRDWFLHDRGDYETIGDLREALTARHPALAKEINAVLDGDWPAMHVLKMETADYLAALKARGYRIYLLSNLSAESYAYIARYPFVSLADGAVFSYRERACKPEEAIYRALLARYGLVPEETVFLDDNPENLAAGAAFGLHCVPFTDLDGARAQTEALLAGTGTQTMEGADTMSQGYFDGSMPRKVLEYYLAHAASAQWITMSDTLEDDIRVILKTGIKFLGRAAGIWKGNLPEEEHFARVKAAADQIHAADPEVILQACIFEALYREDVEPVKVPAFVFEAFGLPVENRYFNYDACLFPPEAGTWDCMPDISQLETQMWFYYRGKRYIDCGCEAFHMGQIHLYTGYDRDYRCIGRVLELLRAYGRQHARRHKVIFDAHSHSLVVNGKSLLDYNAMPFTRFPILDRPGEQLVLVREGKSGGGVSPEGVYEKALPFLYEYDNWGGRDRWALEHLTYEERAWSQWWGGDQISWFACQPEENRNKFLDYSFKWTAVNNPDGFFAFPLMRGIGSGGDGAERLYKLNNRSDACPDGFSQEDAAAALLHAGYGKYRAYANPSDLLDFGAREVDDPATGVRYPEKVVLYGSFQPYVGAVKDDSNSEITRMYYIGEGKYALSFVMPYAGEYDFGVSTWGTLSACVSTAHPFPYSGTGSKGKLILARDNTIVRVTFTYMTNEITVETVE